MREVDHAADAEDQRQAQGEEEVVAAEDETVDDLFEQESELHVTARGYILQSLSALVGARDSSGWSGAGTASPNFRKSCLPLDSPFALTVNG